jgi:tetratricopeptide (TPR) repeat protein
MFCRHAPAVAAIIIATLLAYLPVLTNGFVNWDDPFTLQNNSHLAAPGIVRWAFTTSDMGHYQPIAWLAWSQTKMLFGLDAAAYHALSLLGHLLNASLVYLVCVRLATIAGVEPTRIRLVAVVAAFVFAVHPIRVEAVAWASAFPYVLSLTFLLVAFLAYVNAVAPKRWPLPGADRIGQPFRGAWLGLSIGSYTLSQLTRASAIAFPLVLLAADWYPLRRLVRGDTRARDRAGLNRRGNPMLGRLLLEKLPFFVIALAAALAEMSARELATMHEVGPGARLSMAAAAPFVYLGRTLLPFRLTPLDPLPIDPELDWTTLVLGVSGLSAVTLVAWRGRARWPALAVGWTAYLLLLAPAMGLTPSGQQATADRYMYVPGVVVSLLIGIAMRSQVARASPSHGSSGRTRKRQKRPSDPPGATRWRGRELALALLGLGGAAALGAATWFQAMFWRDSVTLWTRAAELDPRNDIATYNLAIALAEAGREEEAIGRYQQTLRLVPDHESAQHNLNLIRAAQAEREADRLVETGDFDAAIDRYARALAIDPSRMHARAARGMALVERRRFAEAAADLGVAFERAIQQKSAPRANRGDRSSDDLAVANALAFALTQTARHAEAAAVLKRTLADHPDNHELAHNLARLLATAPDPAVRDGTLALRLSLAVRQQTGGRDPRVLDTLAAAYAATGQFDLARKTADEAVTLARNLGRPDLASEILTNRDAYVERGVRRP